MQNAPKQGSRTASSKPTWCSKEEIQAHLRQNMLVSRERQTNENLGLEGVVPGLHLGALCIRSNNAMY